MHVLIVTEGSFNWGMGHLYRCLSFAKEFQKRGFDVRWVVVGDSTVPNFIESNQLSYVTILESIVNWQSSIDLGGAFCAIVDSYHFPVDVYSVIQNKVPYCVWIDDEARIKYPLGFVLNPNSLVKQQNTGAIFLNEYYLNGYEYQVLRSEFSQKKNGRHISSQINKVLILFGGTDVRNLTSLAILCVQKVYPQAKIQVVIPNEEQRQRLAYFASDNCFLLGSQNAQQMVDLMDQADIGVIAAGQTLCEVACRGLPVVAVGVADNQKLHIQALERSGAFLFAGWFNHIDLESQLEKHLHQLKSEKIRQDMSQAGFSFIDGNGVQRVISKALNWSNGLQLRKAEFQDAKPIWELSNQPYVREYSINKSTIPWESHIEWFNSKLNDNNYLMLVVLNSSGEFIGRISYQKNENSLVVSICLSKVIQGKGESHRLLREADLLCFSHWNTLKPIKAEINPDNIASIKAFERAGYKKSSEIQVYDGVLYWVFYKEVGHV